MGIIPEQVIIIPLLTLAEPFECLFQVFDPVFFLPFVILRLKIVKIRFLIIRIFVIHNIPPCKIIQSIYLLKELISAGRAHYIQCLSAIESE